MFEPMGREDDMEERMQDGAIYRKPLWEYVDARSVVQRGLIEHISDLGGSDITYTMLRVDPFAGQACHVLPLTGKRIVDVVRGSRLRGQVGTHEFIYREPTDS